MSNSIFRKDGTAQGVAKQRLIESLAKPDKRVIYDAYADKFVIGAAIIKLMGHKFSVWLTKKFVPGMHEHLISRTRFIDDLIEDNNSRQLRIAYIDLLYTFNLPHQVIENVNSIKIFNDRHLTRLYANSNFLIGNLNLARDALEKFLKN